MTISAPKNKTLYVMAGEKHFWLSTLSTNRADCYKEALKYCKGATDAEKRKDLKRDGYKCVAVSISEQ
jgi:hypothetical protein